MRIGAYLHGNQHWQSYKCCQGYDSDRIIVNIVICPISIIEAIRAKIAFCRDDFRPII